MKEGYWSKRVDVQRAAVQSSELNIHVISQEYGISALAPLTELINQNNVHEAMGSVAMSLIVVY